jgi:hypothetical protein
VRTPSLPSWVWLPPYEATHSTVVSNRWIVNQPFQSLPYILHDAGYYAPKAAATTEYASTTHSWGNCLMPPGLTCGWGTTEATSTRSSTSTSRLQTICSGTFRGT